MREPTNRYSNLFFEPQLSASLSRPGTAPPNIETVLRRDSSVADVEFQGEDEDYGEERKQPGKRKIKIEYIEDKSKRHITFSKRKAGIMKKAYELSTLTGTQVLLLVASETGHVYTFATPKLQPLITKSEGKNLIQKCLNSPDESSAFAGSLAYPERYRSAPPSRYLSPMTYNENSHAVIPQAPANSIAGTVEQDSVLLRESCPSYTASTFNTSYNSSNIYEMGYQPNQNYLASSSVASPLQNSYNYGNRYDVQ